MAEKPGVLDALHAVLRLGSPRRLRRTWRWVREIAGQIRRRRAEPRLTVAVDVNSFYEPLTGVGWYLHQILLHLAGRDDVRLRLYGQRLVHGDPWIPRPVAAFPAGPAIERIDYDAPDGLVIRPWRGRQVLRRLASLLAAADGNQVIFAPNYLFPPLFGLARGARVATIHDLSVWKVPWAVRPDSGEALRELLERTLFEADLFLTPSEAVRRELIERNVAPHRVRAIHHGTGLVGEGTGFVPSASGRGGSGRQVGGSTRPDFGDIAAPGRVAPPPARPDPPLPEATLPRGLVEAPGSPSSLPARTPPRYALHVGTVEPRKNLPALLAAWRLLRLRRADPPPLVLCGGFGWQAEEARREIAAAEAEGWLVHLGYVTTAELAALYQGAEMVALPSFYEGFGLPAVEALRAGAPLLASDIPVLREVAGDAALYAPPDRPDLWADRAGELLADAGLRAELRRRGLERAKQFDWGRAAEETVRAFRAAAGDDRAL